MNTRYTETFLFLSRLSRRSNKGFAMGFVVTAGFLMAATGAVMLLRSSSETEKVAAQQTTAKGTAKADVGVTRIVYFLNQPQHQKLIKKPTAQWQTVADEIIAELEAGSSSSSGSSNQLQGAACDGSGGSDSGDSGASASGSTDEFDEEMFDQLINNEWITISSSDTSAGEYRLTGYELDSETDPKLVNLQVEARALNQKNNTNDLKANNAIRAVNVLLPIIEITPEEEAENSLTPGLWVSDTKNGSGGRQDNSKMSSGDQGPINAVTWIDCSQKSEWKSNSSYVNNSKLDATPIKIGERNINPVEGGGVKQVRDDMLPVPSIPSSGVNNMGSRDWGDCYATLPRGVNGNSSTCSVGAGTDTPVGNIYYYKFTGDDSIKLSNAQLRIKPPEGKKVVIHITGGITISGTGKTHGAPASCKGTSEKVATYIGDPDDPSKLELYSHSSSKAIDISDTTMISAFVHAPKTELKISQAQVRGAAWVKNMDASNSGGGSGCDRAIKQMDVGKTLVMGGEEEEAQPITTLGQVASYQSTEAE
ncbi:hypothetical protein [Crocosphaera sp.]|uniref:hypothetical protein n=1 Tax=Crocosphaera sp. TaxID=2729996 RepID=UPI003F20FB83|nr:hypothetical protein [Crocosphaera sp.]